VKSSGSIGIAMLITTVWIANAATLALERVFSQKSLKSSRFVLRSLTEAASHHYRCVVRLTAVPIACRWYGKQSFVRLHYGRGTKARLRTHMTFVCVVTLNLVEGEAEKYRKNSIKIILA
jgi:hypothetical protein